MLPRGTGGDKNSLPLEVLRCKTVHNPVQYLFGLGKPSLPGSPAGKFPCRRLNNKISVLFQDIEVPPNRNFFIHVRIH